MYSTYEREGEWSGYTIRQSKKGWIVEEWSMVQGEMTGAKLLYLFDLDFPAGTDLEEEWNDYFDNGEMLYERVTERVEGTKVLKQGHYVE